MSSFEIIGAIENRVATLQSPIFGLNQVELIKELTDLLGRNKWLANLLGTNIQVELFEEELILD